jgi:hypothetical protein
VLKDILQHLAENVEDKRDFDSFKEMQNAARKLGKALCVAIRLHKNEAGHKIFDFRNKNVRFSRFRPGELGDWLFSDVIKYKNTSLLYQALGENCSGEPVQTAHGLRMRYNICSQYNEPLYTRGSAEMCDMLLKDQTLDPNYDDGKTPLRYALEKRRYDIARVLIENGARVDAVPRYTTDKATALWGAAKNGHVKDVEFLLRHGANPDYPGGVKDSPITVTRRHKKCQFLLLKVRNHGKDYLDLPNLWDIYDRETYEGICYG